jgi:hypothetical protein
MAGTAKRYDTTTIRAGSVGDLWTGVAVPAAAGRITLDAATGTPDSTANPAAKHLGHTDAGTKITMNMTVTDHFVDEVPYPVISSFDQTTFEITGNFVQVFDEEMLKALTENFATYSTTASSHKQFTIGTPAGLAYRTITLIAPTPMNPSKYFVAQAYSAMNVAGLDITIDRKGRSMTPFTFRAYALTSRAATDQLGNYWWQIV